MSKRIVTGACFALIVLAGIYFQGWVMLGILSFALVVSTYEMYRAFRSAGFDPVRWAGYVFCALVIISNGFAFFLSNNVQLPMMSLLLSMLLAMTRLVLKGEIAVESIMATVFPMLYPGLFYIALINLLFLESRAAVTVALMLSFFAASLNDVFALFTGMLFGRHKLAPVLSPKKTIEGSIGGLVASVLFSIGLPPLLRLAFQGDAAFMEGLAALPPLWFFAVLGLCAGAFSQIGDLTASMIKRYCGVKDFGRLLPGHGGVMDRMDGILFCGAACYLFFRMTGLG